MQITVLFTSMLATMDQMGTVVYLRTVPLEKLLLVNSWIYPCGKRQNRLPYDKSIFNYRLSRARRIVENAFRILAQRFRVFDRRLQIYDHNVIKIVNATCVLHNYLCTARLDVANMTGSRLNWMWLL